MVHSASIEKEIVTPTDLNQHHLPATSEHRARDTLRSYLYHVISIKNRSAGSEEKLDRTSIEALFFIASGSSIVVSVSCETVHVRIFTEDPEENFFLAQRSSENVCEFQNVDNGFALSQHFFFFPSVFSYFIWARDEPHRGSRVTQRMCEQTASTSKGKSLSLA